MVGPPVTSVALGNRPCSPESSVCDGAFATRVFSNYEDDAPRGLRKFQQVPPGTKRHASLRLSPVPTAPPRLRPRFHDAKQHVRAAPPRCHCLWSGSSRITSYERDLNPGHSERLGGNLPLAAPWRLGDPTLSAGSSRARGPGDGRYCLTRQQGPSALSCAGDKVGAGRQGPAVPGKTSRRLRPTWPRIRANRS